jgi:hypothetical protein
MPLVDPAALDRLTLGQTLAPLKKAAAEMHGVDPCGPPSTVAPDAPPAWKAEGRWTRAPN